MKNHKKLLIISLLTLIVFCNFSNVYAITNSTMENRSHYNFGRNLRVVANKTDWIKYIDEERVAYNTFNTYDPQLGQSGMIYSFASSTTTRTLYEFTCMINLSQSTQFSGYITNNLGYDWGLEIYRHNGTHLLVKSFSPDFAGYDWILYIPKGITRNYMVLSIQVSYINNDETNHVYYGMLRTEFAENIYGLNMSRSDYGAVLKWMGPALNPFYITDIGFSDYTVSTNSMLFSRLLSNRGTMNYRNRETIRGFLDSFWLPDDYIEPKPNDVEFEEDEPNLPYWTYQSYRLTQPSITPITFSQTYNSINKTTNETQTNTFSYEYDFKNLGVEGVTNKYFYNPNSITPSDWGDWGINNWMRDLFITVVNAIVYLFQLIFYLLTIAFQFLLLQPILWIVTLVWNYPIFYLLFAIIGIVFYILYGLFWIYQGIVMLLEWLWVGIQWLWNDIILPIFTWIYENVILPIWDWLMENVFLPVGKWFVDTYNWLITEGFWIIWDWIFVVISHVLAIFLFILSFGTIPYVEIQTSILEIMRNVNNGISEFAMVFFTNFILFIGFSATYILLIGLIYIKYIFARSKGHLNRANKLQAMIKVYIIPISLIIMLTAKIIAFVKAKPESSQIETESDKGGK